MKGPILNDSYMLDCGLDFHVPLFSRAFASPGVRFSRSMKTFRWMTYS